MMHWHVVWRSRLLGAGTAAALGLLLSAPGRAAEGAPHVGEPLNASTSEQVALVEHLRRIGAVMYGAWWCPACFRQKNLFGREASRKLPYVECDKEEAGRQRCQAARVRAYPSWDLGGERREGMLSLEQLKTWSGFKGGSPSP